MKTSPTGLKIIKNYEGLRLKIYICPAGKPTIGYGHVIQPGENFNDGISIEQAEKLLEKDLERFEKAIDSAGFTLNQNQFDALVSFVYNIGIAAFRASTMFHRLKLGNYTGAAEQFPRWVYANKVKLAGLEKRRKAEQELFLKR